MTRLSVSVQQIDFLPLIQIPMFFIDLVSTFSKTHKLSIIWYNDSMMLAIPHHVVLDL